MNPNWQKQKQNLFFTKKLTKYKRIVDTHIYVDGL